MVPKFHNVLLNFGFEENSVDPCLYINVSGSKFSILILDVGDVLLTSYVARVRHLLSKDFNMEDLTGSLYVIGVEIRQDKS